MQEIRRKLRQEWLNSKGHNVDAIINKLNPIIRGWANYFRIGVSSEAFSKLDNWMYQRAERYTKHTHPNKPDKWRKNRYWGRLNIERNDFWAFGNKQTGTYLTKFSWVKISRHLLVKGKSSPDDPKLRKYWKEREMEKSKNQNPSLQKLSKRQNYVCPICGESLFNGETIHKHHKTPRYLGGKNTYTNLQLVHYFCHQQIHSTKTIAVEELTL
jgi:RNA-directed DNA polymerase